MIKLGMSGALGRMGQRIIALAVKEEKFKLVAALEYKKHPDLGKLIEGVKVTDNLDVFKECDCIIDFTLPQALVENIESYILLKKPVVVGTTGLTQTQQESVKAAAEVIPIVFSSNMSVGVNVLFRIVKEATVSLKGYKISVEEAHHVHKKDAPSGTAKTIAQIVNQFGGKINVDDICSIREGEIIGDHKIVFESGVDKIELSHHAKTRDIFAEGALVAAQWLVTKKPGLYSMQDVLEGKKGSL